MQQGNTLKILNLMHKALLMSQLLFAGVCIYLVYSKSFLPSAQELDRTLQVIALIAAAGGIYAGMTLFKKKLAQIRDTQATAKEKLALYRVACIMQWALMEGPSIFCIACFLMTGNYAFLGLVVVILFLFVMTAPSKLKILMQLQISEAELDEL
jgi:hypothetical protein